MSRIRLMGFVAYTLCLFMSFLPELSGIVNFGKCGTEGRDFRSIPETYHPLDGKLVTIYTAAGVNLTFSSCVKHQTSNLRFTSMNSYFQLRRNSSNPYAFDFYPAQDMSLSRFKIFRFNPDGSLSINITFICLDKTIPSRPPNVNYFVFDLTVMPVLTSPLNFLPNIAFNIKENTPIGTSFANLRYYLRDRTIPPSITVTNFTIAKDSSSSLDGYRTLTLTSNGDLSLARALDYDDGIRNYTIQVVAVNSAGHRANATIVINVQNVNDNPVRFLIDGCPMKCGLNHYEITSGDPDVDKNKNKSIVTPHRIHAFDLDGEQIMYSIFRVSPKELSNVLVIGNTTGVIRQTKLVENTNTSLEAVLIIQAKVIPKLPPDRHIYLKFFRPDEDYAVVLVFFNSLRAISQYSTSGGVRWFQSYILVFVPAFVSRTVGKI